eukprot:Nitzschia sp. Nitz4//scaffold10_size219509//214941//216092//NITZ4_001468-RA/size219509-processed-gene-0.150-mRNA-1//-1//CDS//3329533040//6281//frame0
MNDDGGVIWMGMEDKKGGVLGRRQGCPCCTFDLFLPPSLVLDNAATTTTTTDNEASQSSGFETLPWTPQEVVDQLLSQTVSIGGDGSSQPLVLVDTHGHAQLERDHDEAYDLQQSLSETGSPLEVNMSLKSIACAVEPDDWKTTLELAAKSPFILPGLGIHPWYLGDGLPSDWLQQLEDLLVQHPSSLVGEIGLCKFARWVRQYPEGKAAALDIQKDVFQQQLKLAAKLRRPVSVHCVNQHGAFLSVLQGMVDQCRQDSTNPLDVFPPAIAMHSFTGTAHQAKELLSLEQQLAPSSPLFYFGFSHTVNWVMNSSTKSRRKGKEAVQTIPEDRLLVESDVHASRDLLGGTAGALAYIAWARGDTLVHTVHLTSRNGLKFISTLC